MRILFHCSNLRNLAIFANNIDEYNIFECKMNSDLKIIKFAASRSDVDDNVSEFHERSRNFVSSFEF